MPKFVYGWKKDSHDSRDFIFKMVSPKLGPLPSFVDLRPSCPPVYDQGQLGSCTANAIGAALQFEQMRQKITSFEPSRLFIYFNERDAEGTIQEDSGAMIRTGIKVVNRLGFCADDLWPYNPSKFATRPDPLCYSVATGHRSLLYERINDGDLQNMKACLASGFPFVFGITVFDSFESTDMTKTGVLQLPASTENTLGGHAVLAVGYDEPSARFIVRNSWGADWGQNGYFTIPFEYLSRTDLASDFWSIYLVN